MTNNRYVVLNCPTLMGNRLCYSKEIKQCADCTDCVIKQVIEKCMHEAYGDAWQIVRAGDVFLANDILKLFDIEEVSE